MAAGALHALALWSSTRLPHAIAPMEARSLSRVALSSGFFAATLAGAVAWFLMSAGMLHTPLSLSLCGASRGYIGAAMTWHLLAMYGPAALAARWPNLAPPRAAIVGGLATL